MDRNRRRFVLVTDVPTPYRNHSYSALDDALRERGIEFEVLFMAERVSTRHGAVDLSEIRFPYRIAKGLHPRYGDDVFHFNPGIVARVLTQRPKWLMLGGAWNMPTTMVLSRVTRSLTATKRILWLEANRDAMVRKTGLVARARRLILRQADAFAVPGQVARETIEDVCGRPGQPFLPFPNLVDESRFGERVNEIRRNRDAVREELGVGAARRLFFWPARLNESAKGIVNFLGAVRPVLRADTRIVIAGEGPDRASIEQWLDANALSQVILTGQQSEPQVLRWLAVSDAVLLPSRRDPNPLAVIEAEWASLPLLISDHCGNWPETLEPGRNGWLVDPDDPDSMRSALLELQEAADETLVAFGRRSRELVAERFATAPAMRRFVDSVERL